MAEIESRVNQPSAQSFQAFKGSVILCEGAQASEIRENYIRRFVDYSSTRFKETVGQTEIVRGDAYYKGYMWDCLIPSRELISESDAFKVPGLDNKFVYVLWDAHKRNAFESVEQFPVTSILKLEFDRLRSGLKYLPEDLYVCDTQFTLSIILTHEYFDNQVRCCLIVK